MLQPHPLNSTPTSGLAGVLEQLRQRGSQSRGVEGAVVVNQLSEESCVREYLDAKLESVSCLKYWERRENEVGNHPVRTALCRLAR